jgi:uncharacterized RDD family membrane protein YckC
MDFSAGSRLHTVASMMSGPVAGRDAGPAGGPGGPDGGRQPAERAGFGPRLAATLVDAAIVLIAWFVAIWLFLEAVTLTGALDPTTLQSPSLNTLTLTDQQYTLAMFAAAILFVIRGAYLVYGWASMGATPGQQLLRLSVADVRAGGRLSVRRSAVRWIVSELPGLGLLLGPGILVWYLAVALSIGRNPERRGIHDIAAGSVMVRRARQGVREEGGHP